MEMLFLQIRYCWKSIWICSHCSMFCSMCLLVIFQFTCTIFIADACVDKADTIYRIVNATEPEAGMELAYYFVTCDAAHPFPWKDEWQVTESALNNVSAACEDDLHQYALNLTANVTTGLYEMMNLTNVALDEMKTMRENLDCPPYQQDFMYITDRACGYVMNFWFSGYVLHAFMILFIIISRVINSRCVDY